MQILLVVFLFLVVSSLFLLTILFLIYATVIDNKQKSYPIKGTILAKLDLFNRMFSIEQVEFKNHKIIKSHKIIRKISLKKWNNIGLVTRLFSPYISKKFAEVFNKLEKGSMHERFSFEAPSFYIKNRNIEYDFCFNKIIDSKYFAVRISYNHIMWSSAALEARQIKEITRLEIAKNTKPVKGFVAFNINTNITYAITRFRELINFKRHNENITYLRYNAILILVVVGNKNWQIKKMITKIKKRIESTNFSNELKYLYSGSAIAISSRINTIKNVNQLLQTLNFLVIYSMKKNLRFLSANNDIDREMFKTYNQALRIFGNVIKNKSFKLESSSIRNISNNKRVVDYYFPAVKNINDELFSWITSDMKNQAELDNAFAEKVLLEFATKPMMVDVNDTWLSKNIAQIKNKNALVVINFQGMSNRKSRIDLIRKTNVHRIAFALYVRNYNDNMASLLKIAKPRFVLVDDNIWTASKLLSSDHFMNLISLNALALENKIKIIYKNPSLILDKKIYSDIGLKYYFQI